MIIVRTPLRLSFAGEMRGEAQLRKGEWEMTPRDSVREYVAWLYEQDNVEDILVYAESTMKEMNVVRSADYAD